MTRYALVRNSDGLVRNVVEVVTVGDYTPPTGHSVVADPLSAAQIGGTWNGSTFAPPPVAPPPDPQITTDKNTVTTFMNAASGTATAAQRDDTIKAVIRYLRRSGQDA